MKIKNILFSVLLVIGFCGLLPCASVSAAGATCGKTTNAEGQEVDYILKDGEKCCDGMVTTMIGCEGTDDGITQLLWMVINILSAAVGIAAVGGVIWGSVLYTTAAGSPEKTKKGITIITDVVIGLVAFAAMWAILNFFIPGGVLNQ